MGRFAYGAPEQFAMSSNARRSNFRHVLAVVAGLLVCAMVLFYTGDSDLILAVGSGLVAVCMVYLAAHFPGLRQRPLR